MIAKVTKGRESRSGCVLRISSLCQNVVRFVLVLVTVTSVVTIDFSHGSAADGHYRFLQKRQKRTVVQSSGSDQSQGSATESYASTNQEWIRFTPTTPSPENVNCYVEVPQTRRVGGMCVNLGSNTGCQAGIHLAFSTECHNARNNRNQVRARARSSRVRRRRPRRRLAALLHLQRSSGTSTGE